MELCTVPQSDKGLQGVGLVAGGGGMPVIRVFTYSLTASLPPVTCFPLLFF